MNFSAALLALVAVTVSEAKIYNRCDLAYEMIHTYGFASGSISEWICLISHESGYNTAAKGGPNYDGSYDWGLFQVNDYYWCSGSGEASKYNDCNVKRGVGQNQTFEKKLPRLFTASKTGYLDRKRLFR